MPGPYPARRIGRLFRRDEREITEKYGEMLAPYFFIEISGENNRVLFSAEANANEGNYDLNGLIVSSVEWEENDCQASMLKMTIENIDMRLHDSRMFTEGNSVDLWMGYDGRQPDYMGRAILTVIEPEFSSDSIPKLSVTGYDISHFMMEEGRAEIQAEGTQWWERRREQLPTNPQNQQRDTATLNQLAENEEARETRRNADRQEGLPESLVRQRTPDATLADTGARAGNVSVRLVSGRPNTTSETNTPRTRTTLRKVRIPRHRQNRGKVWRNLRDDEIANTIFQSYGIVPYTEAIGGNARSRTEVREITINEPAILDNFRDTNEQAEAAHESVAQEFANLSPERQRRFLTSVDAEGARLDLANAPIRAVEVTGERTAQITQEVGGRRVVQKAGTSDWEFLKKLAKNHGFIMFVFYYHETGNWIGYWGSPHNVPQYALYNFNYNYREMTTIKSFRPRISTRGQKTEIDMVFTDPATRKRQRLRVSMENISRYSPEFRGPDSTALLNEPLGNGPEVVLTIHGRRTAVQADRNFRTIDDARRWLMSFWYNHASEFCEAEGEFIQGIPEIHCRHKHEFAGLTRFDGTYFLTQVSHKMSAGSMYTTSFSGYLMVEMLNNEPEQETGELSIESENMGQLTPQALDVLERWRRALIAN